jgi:succinate-semialdehyde dehydrogenase/glutarate-semialdehyde dehydrogenase
VDGRWRPARSGRTLPVEDPSTGEALCSVADAGEGDALDALAAAHAAQAAWAAAPARDRARVLRRAADELERRSDSVAMLITLEMGKPLAESADEVAFAREYLEWCAEEAVRVAGTCSDAPDGSTRVMTRRRPVGPCLIVTPWNFPLAVPARGVAAALAAGCTVILRPSALTPLSALALAEILQEAGLPAGVLNVVVSSEDGATDPLMADGRLRKLTFTGSTAVGRHLIARSADQVLRLSVELGGQAPFIVLADADLDAAVEGAVAAKTRNGGEACTAANRFYVDRAVAEEFTARLTDRLAALEIGRGTDPGALLGPMAGERQRRRLAELVDDACDCGATVALDGGPLPGPGHFFAPVVLTDVPDEARVMREEIFGPIAPIRIVDGEDDAVAQANRSEHGLAAYVYTRDLDAALRVGDALEVGMIAVNRGRVSSAAAPFCGVKQSGFGQAGGAGALDDYLETRVLSVARG